MKVTGRRVAFLTASLAILVLGTATYINWPHLVFWYRFELLGVMGHV